MNGGSHKERCILVTGGAGYIGSHTALQLLLEGYKVVIIDNLDNSEEEAVRRVVELAGPRNGLNLYFYKVTDFSPSKFSRPLFSTVFQSNVSVLGLFFLT